MNKIYIASTAILLLIIFLLWRHDIAEHNTRVSLESAYMPKDSVFHYRDLYNNDHAAIKSISTTHDAAMFTDRKLIDSQDKALKITAKQRDYYIGLVATKRGIITIPIHDTALIPYAYKDSNANYQILHDILYVPYTDSIGLNINQYWKRHWFLGEKHSFLDVASTDTAVKITSLKEIRIDDEFSRWAVTATGGLTLPNLRPAVMVGVSYNIFRFKKRKKWDQR